MKTEYGSVRFVPINGRYWLVLNKYHEEICGKLKNAAPITHDPIWYFKQMEDDRLYTDILRDITAFMEQLNEAAL